VCERGQHHTLGSIRAAPVGPDPAWPGPDRPGLAWAGVGPASARAGPAALVPGLAPRRRADLLCGRAACSAHKVSDLAAEGLPPHAVGAAGFLPAPGESDESSQSDCSDTVFEPPPPPAGAADTVTDASEHERGPREHRGIPWGPWALAPVFRNKVQIGWGATCAQHVNRGDAACCKKQLSQGSFTDAECIARLKMWLLAGTGIPFLDPSTENARARHLAIDPRKFPSVATDPELEAQLAAFLL
jgi:hypothetical protein